MSKHKMMNLISDRTFENIQKLSIVTYKTTLNNKEFDFETYFETTYKSSIDYSLEYLKVDSEPFKDIFYKYFKDIFDLSVKCANTFTSVPLSVRKEVFDYWNDNYKLFLRQVIDEWSKIKKST